MKKKPGRSRPAPSAETQLAETLTVGWMLTVLTALGCQVAWLAAKALAWWRPDGVRFDLLGNLLLFAGAVAGLVSIGLAGLVIRLRRAPVPPAILLGALIVAAIPLAALAGLLLM